MHTEWHQFGKLERAGRTLRRFGLGDYRGYFEQHDLGLVAHRSLKRPTLKYLLFRLDFKKHEDEDLRQNPKVWELNEAAKGARKRTDLRHQ